MTLTLQTLYNAYFNDVDFIEVKSPSPQTFTFRHKNADPKDLPKNLAAAQTLNQNGFSVIIRQHLENQGEQPEFILIYKDGSTVISDLKTPDPNKYASIRSSLKNQFASASNQKINHLVIDVSALNETDYDIAVGIENGFKHNKEIQRVIVIRKEKAVEIMRIHFEDGEVKKRVKRGL